MIENGADAVTIAGNYIGSLDVNGNDAGGSEENGLSGVWLQGANATIGGSNPADGTSSPETARRHPH